MTKIILFDFWGTLVETGVWSPTKQVRNILHIDMPFHDFVVRFEKAMMTQKIATLRDGFEMVFKEFDVPINERKMDDLIGMWNKCWMLARPYDELKEVLEELQKEYKLVLISNTDPLSVRNVLDKFDLQKYFSHIFLSCELGVIKTDEEFLHKVFHELSTKASECMLVGDSIDSDMVMAQRAKVSSLLIDRSQNRDYPDKITTLRDLKGALEE